MHGRIKFIFLDFLFIIYISYITTGRKTIENSEFLREFRPGLEGVSVLRIKCTKLYEQTSKQITNTSTNPGIENGGLLKDIHLRKPTKNQKAGIKFTGFVIIG